MGGLLCFARHGKVFNRHSFLLRITTTISELATMPHTTANNDSQFPPKFDHIRTNLPIVGAPRKWDRNAIFCFFIVPVDHKNCNNSSFFSFNLNLLFLYVSKILVYKSALFSSSIHLYSARITPLGSCLAFPWMLKWNKIKVFPLSFVYNISKLLTSLSSPKTYIIDIISPLELGGGGGVKSTL